MDLFEGSSSSSEDEGTSNIKINQEFACRFEHNKRIEDLQRHKELKKHDTIEDSNSNSSEESEDDKPRDDLIDSNQKELQFFNALVKVKKLDPILNEKDTKLFDYDDDIDDSEESRKKGGEKKKKKPLYLKHVMAKQLMEERLEFEEKCGGMLGYDAE